jgi:Protein of unknown function (DUF3108)
MRKAFAAILFSIPLISFCGYNNAQVIPLLEYSAEYEASANGLAATATRSLRSLDANSYRLSNSLEASLAGQSLARLEQASEFSVTEQHIVPRNYTYQLSGVSRASHAIFFNWDAGIAMSSEDDESWQIPLQDSVMDSLSYQVAIRKALLDNAERETVFSFEIVDGDAIELHEYRLVSEEQLATPLGELNTVKLERVRAADDDRVTEIWLAVDWNYLLTRIEQLNSSGLRIVLELKSATIDGAAVTAKL